MEKTATTKIKERLNEHRSLLMLVVGTLNLMAGLHGFDGGLAPTIAIGAGVFLLALFARGF